MRKKFLITFAVVATALGASLNVYFSKTNKALDMATLQNIQTLAFGEGFSAQNTGPATYSLCIGSTPDSGPKLKYCDCKNSEMCTQVLVCP
jgi:hypothetical protein